MRSLFFAFAFMLIGTFAFANDAKSVNKSEFTYTYSEKGCTVSYTDSRGVTFTAKARTCSEAYEMILPHIEAE